jgi:membrane protein
VFGAISTAVNYAWGVEKQRSFWKHKLLSFVMLLFAGLILLIALLLISATQVVGASWFAEVLQVFPWLGVLRGFAVRHATTLLFIAVVGLIFYFVPNAKVRFRDVWIGALITGLLWKGALEGFSWYMRDMTRFTRVNGSIAAVVVFLVWVYIQAVILLYGVEFTAAYARLRRGRPDEVPAAATPRT